MNIVIFEKEEIHSAAIELLSNNGFSIYEDNIDNKDKNDVEAIFIRSYTKVTIELLNKYPNLKYVLRAGVGLDNIDIEECRRRNIEIFSSPGSNSNAVSELVVAFMIMLMRKVIPQMYRLKNKEWRSKDLMGEELKGKTVGIIGCGAIGRLVAKKIGNFEVGKIFGYDPYLTDDVFQQHNIERSELDDLLKNSDIVTLHLPLLPETKNLLCKDKFALMKNSAYIINTSRGGIVNEEDLIVAINNNQIAGAALDVFEHEPKVIEDLLNNDKIIPTPHIGSFTFEADREMSVQVVERFIDYLNTVKS